MTTTILGLDVDDWHDVAKLYFHHNGKDAPDLWKLREFWEKLPKHTPEQCLKIGLEFSEAQKNDSVYVADMLNNFLIGMFK